MSYRRHQRVKFEHPKTGDQLEGSVLRPDQNDRPSGCEVSIVKYEDGIISVPNTSIQPVSE